MNKESGRQVIFHGAASAVKDFFDKTAVANIIGGELRRRIRQILAIHRNHFLWSVSVEFSLPLCGFRRISLLLQGRNLKNLKRFRFLNSFCLLCEFTVHVKSQNDYHTTSVMLVVECRVWKYNGFLNRKVKWNCKMADLEAVLADVSYLMAMEKSKCTPAARASKKIILPDPR